MKSTDRVAPGEGPEFKPQFHRKKKKKEEINVVHPCNEAVLNNKNI
jgi:hypothetical protein